MPARSPRGAADDAHRGAAHRQCIAQRRERLRAVHRLLGHPYQTHVAALEMHGRRFRILKITDDVTRECLAAIPDTSISGKRVIQIPLLISLK